MKIKQFLSYVEAERESQINKYGRAKQPLYKLLNTLMREMGEVNDAASRIFYGDSSRYKEMSDSAAQQWLETELIQVAAVCFKIIEDMERE